MSSSRDTDRDMRRLASLYNGIAMVQLQALCWEALFDHELRNDGVLEIIAQTRRKPIAQAPLFSASISENLRRTFVSINKCVAVIVWNTGWLATCAASLNIKLEEISIAKPKRVHDVELRYVPDDRLYKTKYWHTIIRLTPRSGEDAIVADASYAQYSFDNSIDTFADYMASKVQRHCAYTVAEFGEEYIEYECRDELPEWGMSKRVAISRSANKIMVRELSAAGGIRALLDISPDDFVAARDRIVGVMRREMEALRIRLERIVYESDPDARYLEALEKLREDCDGPGHQFCMQSLEFIREGKTAELKHNF